MLDYRPVVVKDATRNDLGKWMEIEIREATFFDLRGSRIPVK
jgi:tRNA A37 methylthiotransferase MiaB